MQGMTYKKQHIEVDSLLHTEPILCFQHQSDMVKFLCTHQQPGSRILYMKSSFPKRNKGQSKNRGRNANAKFGYNVFEKSSS